VLGIPGQHQHPDALGLGLDHGERIDAALPRHVQVQQQHVDGMGAHEVDGLAAGRGLRHNTDAVLLVQVAPQGGARDGMVVRDADPDDAHGPGAAPGGRR
jgi:hypothetical protein